MHDLLTKGKTSPVIKKAAAIFLLITLVFIGSTPTTATQSFEGIAATQFVPNGLAPVEPTLNVREILNLPVTLNDSLHDSGLDEFLMVPLHKAEDALYDVSRIPTITGMVTSSFGWRKHPIRGGVRHHNGVDIAARYGSPVLAPASGIVTFSGWRNGYGYVIEIDHQNGYTSLLAHHSKLLVKVDDIVTPDTVIAKAGRSGWASGVHVHVEVRFFGELRNPKEFIMDTRLAQN